MHIYVYIQIRLSRKHVYIYYAYRYCAWSPTLFINAADFDPTDIDACRERRDAKSFKQLHEVLSHISHERLDSERAPLK